MSRKPTPYNQILHLLHDLHKRFPTFNMGRHLATALDGYGDVWGMTDGEMLFALEKYSHHMECEKPEDIDKIIRDASHLDDILKEEDYGQDY